MFQDPCVTYCPELKTFYVGEKGLCIQYPKKCLTVENKECTKCETEYELTLDSENKKICKKKKKKKKK